MGDGLPSQNDKDRSTRSIICNRTHRGLPRKYPRAARNIAKKFDARNAIRRADLGFGLSLGNAFVRIKVMSRYDGRTRTAMMSELGLPVSTADAEENVILVQKKLEVCPITVSEPG